MKARHVRVTLNLLRQHHMQVKYTTCMCICLCVCVCVFHYVVSLENDTSPKLCLGSMRQPSPAEFTGCKSFVVCVSMKRQTAADCEWVFHEEN